MRKLLMMSLFAAAVPLLAQDPEVLTTAPAPARLTLESVMHRALDANLRVASAEAEIDALRAQQRLILSGVLPRVSVSGSLARNSVEVVFGEGENAATILPKNDWNARLNLSQPLFAGNRDRRAYEQAKVAVASAREDLELTREQVLLAAVANFFTVATGEALLEVEQQNTVVAQRFLQQTRDFFDAGEVTQVEPLRAEARVKAAQRGVAAAIQLRDTAAGRLRIDLRLDGPITVDTSGAVIPAPPPEHELIASALERRSEVAIAGNEVRIAELEVRKQRGFAYPTLTLDAAWIQQKAQFPYDSYGQAAVNFNVPIWQSGEVGARVRIAEKRAEQARLALAEVQQSVEEDVRTALLDLTAAETSLSLAQEQATAAQAEYDQVFELYRAQEATSLDVQSTEATLRDARRAVVESSLAVQMARLRAWYSAGLLEEVANSEVDR